MKTTRTAFATAASRIKLSPGALYTLLNAELKRRRTVPCACQMPLPYHVKRPDEVSANWRIGTPAPCPRGCDVLIVEIAAHLWPKWDLLEAIVETEEENRLFEAR